MLSANKWPSYLFKVSLLISIVLIIFNFFNFFEKFVTYFLMLSFILTTLFGALIMYRDKIVVSATIRIMNKYPDLIQKTKDNS